MPRCKANVRICLFGKHVLVIQRMLQTGCIVLICADLNLAMSMCSHAGLGARAVKSGSGSGSRHSWRQHYHNLMQVIACWYACTSGHLPMCTILWCKVQSSCMSLHVTVVHAGHWKTVCGSTRYTTCVTSTSVISSTQLTFSWIKLQGWSQGKRHRAIIEFPLTKDSSRFC